VDFVSAPLAHQQCLRTASVMAPWILPSAVITPVPTTMHLALPAVTTVPCASQGYRVLGCASQYLIDLQD